MTKAKLISRPIKIILGILLCVLLLVLSISQIVGVKDKLRSPYTITVSGEGKAIGIPDVASINFSVITEKMSAKDVMQENAKEMNEIIQFIKESGVEAKDVKTSGYYLTPRYDWTEGKRISKGYELTSTLAVKIRNLEKISDLIDGAVALGANQVSDIQFVIDEPEKLQKEAREKAISQAKEKAEEIAKAAGLKLGKVISFSESATPSIDFYPRALSAKEAAGGGATPEIEAGSQEIQSVVSLIFEVK